MTNEDAETNTYPLEKQDRNKSRISFQPYMLFLQAKMRQR